MDLKNIFKMTKTDRYTQDGRDQLAKLQETEDVKYKTGDISQKTGLQKQPDGSWAPPKKGGKPAAKKEAGSINRTPERIAKETAIMEALNLSTGEDNNLHKMSDETIERLYARTQEKPAAGKTTIRQGPNTKTLNETPAEHIKKNLDAYTGNSAYDMEELVLKPSGYERQTSARIPSGGQSVTYTKEGEEDITLFFDKDGELENADVPAGSKPATSKPDTKEQTKALMEKYKDLPGVQKKDALYAATFEGSSIGMTQTSMERQGWDLVQADDDVHVYAKPDGSKVTMKHDGQKITSSEYKAPGSKPAAGNNLKWDEMPNGRVWTTRTPGGKPLTVIWNREKNGDVWYGRSDSETKYKSKEEAMNAPIGPEKKRLTWSPNASVSEKLNDIIKLGEGSEDRTTGPGKYISPKVQENYVRKALSKRLGATEESIEDLIDSMDEKEIKNAFNGFMENYSSDSAPRQLTGDCKIRIRQTQDVKYKTGDISQKTGLQKQPDGSWAPPKGGKLNPAAKKEDRITKMQKETGKEAPYGRTLKGTPKTPDDDFRTERTKARAESKPAAAPKLNQVEKVDNTNRPYRIKGTQFYFETPEEAETAIVAGTRGEGKTYAKPSSDATINEIQNALGFKLDSEYAGKYSMDDFMKKTGKDEYGVRVWSFGTNSKGTLIDTIVEGYNKPNATIKKENGEWRLHYMDRDGKKMIVTPKGREWPTSDSAPRILTGDTKIRIRK